MTITVAVMLAVASAQDAASSDQEHLNAAVERAKAAMNKDIEHAWKNNEAAINACKEEVVESKEWKGRLDPAAMGEDVKAGHSADKIRRMQDKRELLAALQKRIGVLAAFIKTLDNIRTKLGEHITRVNDLFRAKYTANLNDMHMAGEVLRELGMHMTAQHSPELNPIKLPYDPEDDKAPNVNGPAGTPTSADDIKEEKPSSTGATGAAAQDSAQSMALLETQMQTAVSACRGDGCKTAYTLTFQVYVNAYQFNVRNYKDFEAERVALGGFRDGLDKLYAMKVAKLEKLQAQEAELIKAINNPEGTLDDLFPLIDKHVSVITEACARMAKNEATIRPLRQKCLDVLNGKGAGAGAIAPAATEPTATEPAATGPTTAGTDAVTAQSGAEASAATASAAAATASAAAPVVEKKEAGNAKEAFEEVI